MKIQLENISPDANSSFRLLLNPKLNDLFFWHFHPEYELVYIEGASGTRHVGQHTSRYTDSDLVLIGSNIPHLNFDYGVKTHYEKVVLHIQPAFVQKLFINVPELNHIHELFVRSRHGLAFTGKTKHQVGHRLKKLHQGPPFNQFLDVLHILDILASSEDKAVLHDQPYVNRYSQKEQDRLKGVYAYVDQHYTRRMELQEAADICNLSTPAFCRYFKKATGQSFIQFLNQYRISQAKRLLLQNNTIGEACYESGFESLSYFSRTFKKITGETPGRFRKRYLEGEG